MIKLEDKTHEELVEQVRRLQDRLALQAGERMRKEQSYVKRLSGYRKAKSLANARADKAEAALRSVIDKFFAAILEQQP